MGEGLASKVASMYIKDSLPNVLKSIGTNWPLHKQQIFVKKTVSSELNVRTVELMKQQIFSFQRCVIEVHYVVWY